MRNKKILSLTIALIFVLLTTTVYAAYGSITALSGGNSSARQTSSGIYNDITHWGDAKEVLADSDRIQNIYVRNLSAVDGIVYGDKQKTEHYQTHTSVTGSYSRKVDTEKKAITETLARARYTDDTVSEDIAHNYIYILSEGIAGKGLNDFKEFYNERYNENKNNQNSKEDVEEYIFNERNELKEKELEILENKNMDISLISSTEERNGIFHINAVHINDYPEYRTLYIDYMDEHVGIGDYIPSGVYIDKELNKAYFVSILDNEIYTYDLKSGTQGEELCPLSNR